MTLFDDTSAHNSDSTTTIVSEAEPVTDNHNPLPVATAASSEEAEQAALGHDEKPAATASEDFASALETFTTEAEEAAGDDRIIKGTVLKLTATHVVVDIGAKSESSSSIKSAATSLFPVRNCSKVRSRKSVLRRWSIWKKARSSLVWSRISPSTARSSTLAGLMACCTSQTCLGADLRIREIW